MSTTRRGSIAIVIMATGLGLPDSGFARGQGCLTWEKHLVAPHPGYGDAAMAYDSVRGVTVFFRLEETWEWDGAAWSQRRTAGPSRRYHHAMAFDAGRGVTVLFGGRSDVGDTWEWDGSAWTLRATSGPSPRDRHAMAYDSARGVVVLFGGGYRDHLGYHRYDDTWEWDGQSWTFRSVAGPSPRSSHSMAYDSRRGVTVLHGGSVEEKAGYGSDTWEWDGQTWTLRISFGPLPRQVQAMVYDSARDVTVLFVGLDDGGETWEWDGTAWTLRSNDQALSEFGYLMAYDSARSVSVLFGPSAWDTFFYSDGQTWEWDGTTWVFRGNTAPTWRYWHAMAYDSAHGVTVLFGGRSPAPGYLGDTWEWDGTTWSLSCVTGVPPRERHAMAYDGARSVVVLFGGMGLGVGHVAHCCPRDDTWEWDGESWTQRAASGPSARYAHAMAYDSVRQVTVLFGGYGRQDGEGQCFGDTWEWDSITWTQRDAAGPTMRGNHAMVYDSERGVTVLFGGQGCDSQSGDSYSDDTWEWDGTSWTQRAAGGPCGRGSHAMVYDDARSVTVLFGGYTTVGYQYKLDDVWEWDGIMWTERVTRGPPARAEHSMAYDSAREATVVFGGYSVDRHTWELKSGVISADSDGDCDVDLFDISVFQRCSN